MAFVLSYLSCSSFDAAKLVFFDCKTIIFDQQTHVNVYENGICLFGIERFMFLFLCLVLILLPLLVYNSFDFVCL